MLKARKGITPVIATILLIMMAVAAAGGAYTWITQIQDQFKERAQTSLDRSVDLIDLRCYKNSTGSYIDAFFKNSGERAIDLNPVDLRIRNSATGSVNFTLTRTGISLSTTAGSLSDGVTLISGNSDFKSPGASTPYRIRPGSSPSWANFETGDRYTVEFEFTDEGGLVKTETCQAQQE